MTKPTTVEDSSVSHQKVLAQMRREIREAAYVYISIETYGSSVGPGALLKITKTQANDLIRQRPKDFAMQIQTLFAETDWPRKAVCLYAAGHHDGNVQPTPYREDFLGITVDAYTLLPYAK